jgi:hypothetical protein
MPELTAHIVGIDHPLGVYCASELIRKGFLVSGTLASPRSSSSVRLALKQLQIPCAKKIHWQSVCSARDYVIFIDSDLRQLAGLTRALNSGTFSLSWYKCLFLLTKQATGSQFDTWISTINGLMRYKKVQKLLVYVPYLFGEGILPKTHLGLSSWVDRISQKKFVHPHQQVAQIEPLYIKDAATHLIEMFLLPARYKTPLVLSGCQTLPAINWGFMLQSQAAANQLGKFQLISNKRQQIYDWQLRYKHVYPNHSQAIESAVSNWLLWLKKPTSLMGGPKTKSSSSSLAKIFIRIGIGLMAMSLIGAAYSLATPGPSALFRELYQTWMVAGGAHQTLSENKAAQALEAGIINALLSMAHKGLGPGEVGNLNFQLVEAQLESSRLRLHQLELAPKNIKTEDLVVHAELVSVIEAAYRLDKTAIAIVIYNPNIRNGVGGLVQAVSLIEVSSGKISSATIYEIGELNQKLDGLVSPPPDLSTYKLVDNWGIEDALWAPDLSAAGSTISWFVEKQTGLKPDVVIGFPETLLSEWVTVSAKIPDANDKNFISANLNYLANIIQHQDTEVGESLISKMITALKNNRGFIMSGPRLSVQGDVTHPSMCLSRLPHPNCIMDYLMVNITHTRALQNPQTLLSKEDHYLVVLDDHIEHKHEVLLGNATPEMSELLLRLYLPASLTSLQATHNGFVVPLDPGNESVGEYLLEMKVLPESRSQISLTYKTPKRTNHQWQYLNQVGLGPRSLTLHHTKTGSAMPTQVVEVLHHIIMSANP